MRNNYAHCNKLIAETPQGINLKQKYSKNMREITRKHSRRRFHCAIFLKITPRHGIFPRTFHDRAMDTLILKLTKLCVLASCKN